MFGGRLHPTQQILPPGMPGYEEYKLYPGPDMAKAKQLIAEANPADKDITVWTDDEPDRKRIGEYYHDLLTQLGFNATLKVIAGDVYLTTIGNQSTPDLDTGFADWFQDFPHPDDFFRPLLTATASCRPTATTNRVIGRTHCHLIATGSAIPHIMPRSEIGAADHPEVALADNPLENEGAGRHAHG